MTQATTRGATAWTHKVVKVMRGGDGDWFDFPTAATFASEASAREYAESFAREQGEAGVVGARIVVRSRRKSLRGGWPSHHVATYYPSDYAPE